MVLAELTGADLAVVVVTGCSVVAVVALLFVLQRALVAVRRLTAVLDEVRTEAAPLLDDLGTSVAGANEQLERIDKLMGSAESISATVDATSKLAYRALSAPVIKTVAVGSGAARAAKRMRRE